MLKKILSHQECEPDQIWWQYLEDVMEKGIKRRIQDAKEFSAKETEEYLKNIKDDHTPDRCNDK